MRQIILVLPTKYVDELKSLPETTMNSSQAVADVSVQDLPLYHSSSFKLLHERAERELRKIPQKLPFIPKLTRFSHSISWIPYNSQHPPVRTNRLRHY